MNETTTTNSSDVVQSTVECVLVDTAPKQRHKNIKNATVNHYRHPPERSATAEKPPQE